jgi:hypothetical protein
MGIGFTAACSLLLLCSSQSLVVEPCQFSHANISNRPLLANCDALCMRPSIDHAAPHNSPTNWQIQSIHCTSSTPCKNMPLLLLVAAIS